MKAWSKKVVIVIFVTSAMLMWAGCSDNNDVIVSGNNTIQLSGVESYYPLTEGYQTTYAVHDIGGSDVTITNRITGTDTTQGFALICQTAQIGLTTDTGYFYLGADAILYFDYPSATPEKFLQTPLTNGSVWDRFPTIQDDFSGILPDWNNGNNSNSKTVPTDGSSQMIVVGSDFVTLSHGDSYSFAIKVVNTGSNGTQNAYWFVPGVGLVKYILGVSQNDPTTGNVVGELTSYKQF